jgi:translocator protein
MRSATNFARRSKPSPINSHVAWRIAALVLVIATLVTYVGLSGLWVGTDSGWYRSLIQPAWQPPPIIFGVVWPYNFIALLVVGSTLAWQSTPRITWVFIAFFILSVAAALTWAYQFYVPHQFIASAIALTLAALLTAPMLIAAFNERWWLGALLVPYQLWLVIAASLAWGYQALNSAGT